MEIMVFISTLERKSLQSQPSFVQDYLRLDHLVAISQKNCNYFRLEVLLIKI